MRMLRTCALLLIAFTGSSDAASTHAQTAAMKQLRVGVKRDVDDSEADADTSADSEDSDDDVAVAKQAGPAPAPAAAAAPATAPAPGPLNAIKEDEEIQMQDMMGEASDMLEDHGLSDVRSKHKQELAGLMWIEETLEEKLDTMNDEEYRKKIEKEEKPVADETSPGLANMLGEMREDMHEYALPFYKKVLKEKIEQLEKDQHQLVLSIADDAKEAEKKEKEEKEPEKEKEEKKKEEIEEPSPAPVEEKKGGTSVGNNTIFIAAAAVAVLAALAYILSRRGSTPRGA